MGRLNVSRRDDALAILAQAQRDFVTALQLEYHALEVQKQVDDVFLHAINGRVFVHNTGDRHLGRRMSNHRRQKDATQRVAQRVAVATLERLKCHLGAIGARRLDLNRLGF